MSIQFQTKYLRETQVKEDGMGTSAVAPTLEPVRVKKKVKEDAPRLAAGKADISTYTKDGFTKAKRGKGVVKGIEIKDLWEDEEDTISYGPDTESAAADNEISLKEGKGYSQFKKQASVRTKPQQMHEAAKLINKKLDEINKLLQYTEQMKMELSEGEESLEYAHNTKKVFEKIKNRVVEAYSKIKKLN